MKKGFAWLSFVALMGIGSTAAANVTKVGLSVALREQGQCGFKVRILEVEQNMFNGNERLEVDGTALGTFGSLLGSGRTLQANSEILFASPSLAEAEGLTADVTISDEECDRLTVGIAVEFYGSFGPLAGSVTLPESFGENTAVAEDGSATPYEESSWSSIASEGTDSDEPRERCSGHASVAGPAGRPPSWVYYLTALFVFHRWRRRRYL